MPIYAFFCNLLEYFGCFILFWFEVILGIEHRASHMVGMHSATELQPRPLLD